MTDACMAAPCSADEDDLDLVTSAVRELPDEWQRAFALDQR